VTPASRTRPAGTPGPEPTGPSPLARRAIAQRRFVVAHDQSPPEAVAARHPRSAAAVPLLLRGDALGALEVRAAPAFAFDESAAVALSMAANLVAITLDHADLVEVERRSRAVAEAAARRFGHIFEANPAALAIVSLDDDRVLDVNPAMESLTGFAREALIGRRGAALGWWREDEVRERARALGNSAAPERETRIRHHDGSLRNCLISTQATEFVDPDAAPQRALLVLIIDVTERLAQQQQLRDLASFRESLMTFVGETLSHGFDTDFYHRLLEAAVQATPGAEAGSLLLRDTLGDSYRYVAAVGYDLEGLAGVTFEDAEVASNAEDARRAKVVHGFTRGVDPPGRREALTGPGRLHEIKTSILVPIELEGRRSAVLVLDNLRDAHAFGPQACDLAEAFAAQVATLIKRRSLEHALEHMAYHDNLTGLPNRTLFRDRLQQAVARARRVGGRGAALFVDLDNLKVTNDTLGHAVGDALLQAVAERLRYAVRAEDTVARIGGDEFTLVLPETEDAAAVALVAKKILTAMRLPFHLLGHEVHVTASIGVTMFPDDASEADTLIRHGDTAMYQAKLQGKDRYRFFTPEMNHQLVERAALEAQLRLALQRDEFRLHYQPRVALADGRITSVEALARWTHPTRGDVPPSTFIPVAEDAGLIGAVGTRLLRLACEQARAWRDAGTPIRVAFNLSAKQLQERDVVRTVQRVLGETGLDPALLELELTESAVMRNVDENVVKLGELRALGVHISIDDFGSAYSSLNYLKRLPATALKVDKSFMRDLAVEGAAGRHDAAIVRAVVALAQALELVAIAEGVETVAQLRFLHELGCEQGQGFLFARPTGPAELGPLLRRGSLPLPDVD
jgi:diguanylate cyclase (GGDEF)-like protein/PAS domain S-box-containing protein